MSKFIWQVEGFMACLYSIEDKFYKESPCVFNRINIPLRYKSHTHIFLYTRPIKWDISTLHCAICTDQVLLPTRTSCFNIRSIRLEFAILTCLHPSNLYKGWNCRTGPMPWQNGKLFLLPSLLRRAVIWMGIFQVLSCNPFCFEAALTHGNNNSTQYLI